LSNIDAPWLVYVARITNAEVFSPLMVSAIADRMAMELAMPMAADARYLQLAMTRYNTSFMVAASSQYEQGHEGPDLEPPAVRARY
jgi:mannose/fructose/N-acetylgalactosamine-specific phosphotransferase system component IIC